MWCGDNASGSRLGIINKNEKLIFTAEKYLKKIYQKPKFVLLKSSKLDATPNLPMSIDEIWEVKNMAGTWVILVFCVNGILKSFFDYLLKNLDEFLDMLPRRNIFFAGLFDAEGSVFFEDECFRWSCRNMKEVEIYRKYLNKFNLFGRYDGSNIVTNNKIKFSELILPYLRHEEKINRSRLICFDEGYIDDRFRNILRIIKNNEGITIMKLAKNLKKSKAYSQVGFLKKYKYIRTKDYPKRVYITMRGLKEIGGDGTS